MQIRIVSLLTISLGVTFSALMGGAAQAENPWVEQARNRESMHQTSQQPLPDATASPARAPSPFHSPVFSDSLWRSTAAPSNFSSPPTAYQQQSPPTSPAGSFSSSAFTPFQSAERSSYHQSSSGSYSPGTRDNPHNFRFPDVQRAGFAAGGASSQGAFPGGSNPTWQEQQVRNREMQRQALQQQAEQGYSPQVAQGQRWEAEWRQQHPGEPMPNFGQLEKMHRGEIQANIHAGFAQMRQRRQAELQRNRNWARELQMKLNAEQHVTWGPAQWKQWDQRYDAEQKQNAQDYLNAIARERERMDEEYRRTGKNPYAIEPE